MSLSIFRKIRRKEMRGDAPVTCMLIIAGVLIACIACYYMFWYNRALERAATAQDVVVVKKQEPAAFNAYRLRMRDKLIPTTGLLITDTRKACNPVLKNKVTDTEETLSEINKVIDRQREYIGEVNGQSCPAKYVEMHKNVVKSIGFAWKGAETSKKALKEEDQMKRKAMLKEANEDLKRARRFYNLASEDCKKAFES
ncbi:TPA: hypothetical protein DD394_01330 [bacterium UBP9_UBA11836]|nr:hypothetical protein [bacterium UBP9_UBA11836]